MDRRSRRDPRPQRRHRSPPPLHGPAIPAQLAVNPGYKSFRPTGNQSELQADRNSWKTPPLKRRHIVAKSAGFPRSLAEVSPVPGDIFPIFRDPSWPPGPPRDRSEPFPRPDPNRSSLESTNISNHRSPSRIESPNHRYGS